jgi:BNR repeat-like domain
MRSVVSAAGAAVVALAAVGVALAVSGPFTISGPSPFASCAAPAVGGTNYPNTEVEPFVAVNPATKGNAIAVWQQDRWSNGGAHALVAAASFDGGQTWANTTALPFNQCAPGGLSYERASDPWVSIGPDGTAYAVSISFNMSNNDNAVAAVTSTDGGKTWSNLHVLRADNGQNQLFNDKESVTADPAHAGTAYAVWDQLAGPTDNPSVFLHNASSFTGPSLFSKTTDGGKTWSTAQAIVPTRQNQQTIGNEIVVGPTGTLYDFFTLITGTGSTAPHGSAIAYITSNDGGASWSSPQIAQQLDTVTVVDPNTGQPLRTADFAADVAIDRSSGQIYLVWQDARNTHVNGKNHATSFTQILESTGTPTANGISWSAPAVISVDDPTDPATTAFLPTVSVRKDGTVGVYYYDFTGLTSDNTTTLPTSIWFTTDFGQSRTKVTGPFNFLAAPDSEGFFLGDYQGLAANGKSWIAVYDKTNCSDSSCVGGANPDDTYASILP